MKGQSQITPILRSVRTKLLVMLAVLSLPLLIISIFQLNNHRRTLNEQAATLSRIETTAVAGALSNWLETHPAIATNTNVVASSTETLDLFSRLQQHISSGLDANIVVFDAQGRPLKSSSTLIPSIDARQFSNQTGRWQWSDGMERITSVERVEPFGWNVAVGVPLAENTSAGHSVFALAATWAFALVASILIGFWAVGRFTNPLRKLAQTATTLGEGHLQERVAVETEDEVGALAQGFNVMAAQLQTKFNELQTQGAFIEDVLDGLPLGIVVLDASLIVRKANPTFAEFVGRDASLLKGRGLYEAAAGLAVLRDVVEDVRRTRKPFVTYGLPLNLVARNKEASAQASSGDAVPHTDPANFWDVTIWPTTEKSAVRGDLIFVLSEVSKRVRAEKLATSAFALERTRAAELESVINQMNEGVVIIDRHKRYKVNPAAAEIIGRKMSEFRDGAQALIEDIALRDLSGHQLSPAETPLHRALVERDRVSGEQFQVIQKGGEKRVVTISATPLSGQGEIDEGAVAIFRDITDEFRQRDELLAAYDRLREHDRLKTAFVSNMTHELRTPLNVIIGLCQLLARDPQSPLAPLQNEAVTRMERNARSLVELVNDLLDYSRLEAGRSALHLEKVDVAEAVKGVVEDYANETKDKRIELSIVVAPELGNVLTDRHKMTQVLSNLIGNAVKFTAEGQIKIAAAPLDDERWYLEVSDTGIGISNDALTYIFDEFRQVDDRLARAYGGTGLGLAITRKIVELLEGEITVESKPDEGSRFRITWPRRVRQHTGTGSLLEKNVPRPTDLRIQKTIRN
jgi:PAS domain S-box-containing protein